MIADWEKQKPTFHEYHTLPLDEVDTSFDMRTEIRFWKRVVDKAKICIKAGGDEEVSIYYIYC